MVSKKTLDSIKAVLLVAGLVMGGLCLVFLLFLRGCYPNRSAAEAQARKWLSNIPNATNVECTQFDTDRDGYVSCTVFRKNAEPVAIECAIKLSLNSGCRMPKLRSMVQ